MAEFFNDAAITLLIHGDCKDVSRAIRFFREYGSSSLIEAIVVPLQLADVSVSLEDKKSMLAVTNGAALPLETRYRF